MPHQARLFIAVLCSIICAAQANAQAPVKSKKAPSTSTASARSEADPLAAVRRTTAISLVTSLADEARSFRDSTLRARVQAQAADALWDSDKERARALFRRAWEAAESGDQENLRRMERDRREQLATRGSAIQINPPNLRAEVLRLASRRDRTLGEEFLAKLDEAKKQEADSTTPRADTPQSRRDSRDMPPASARRLRLALELLRDGDTERAIQFADAALDQVSSDSIEFLATLREKNAEAADQRYAALLARAANDPESDANTVLVLSSYVLTPFLYMTIEPRGGISSSQRRRDIRPPADFSSQLRAAFFNAAAQILLRPLPAPDQDHTTGGRAGAYFVIARLLPLFEQYAPDKAPAMRARLAALSPDLPQRQRDGIDRDLTRGLVPEDQMRDEVQEALDRASSATDAGERDRAYMWAALSAVFKGDARASEYVDKIEDNDLRRQVRAFIDFHSLQRALEKNDGAEALRLASNGELTHPQRVWGYTEAARLFAKSERTRAIEALDLAVTEARRIGEAEPDRARAFVAIATQYFEIDRARAWELISEVIKAANAAADFTGQDAGLMVRVETKGSRSTTNFDVPSFDLTGIFGTLAREDMNRAVELARSFTSEAPRAVATLAIARAVLDKKP